MKTKNLLVYFLMIFISDISSAQITFQKTYRWSGPYNRGYSGKQTVDGGYIVTGIGSFHGAYLIKTNANGDPIWRKAFGGGNEDIGLSVQQTTDSGYIIAGRTNSFNTGTWDIYLIKTDVNGDSLWTRIIGGANDDYGNSVQQTADGGYIIVGSTITFGVGLRDVYLIKTDANGNLLWTKTFGGTDDDEGTSVAQTTDGGYIIVGYTTSFAIGYYDIYLIRTNINGDTLWTKTITGVLSEVGTCVRQTTDGGYIITGYTSSFGAGASDVYLIKSDSTGNLTWAKTFGGTDFDYGFYVEQISDGGYIVAGSRGISGAGFADVYLIRTDTSGNSGCNESIKATIVTSPPSQVSTPATIVTSPATIITTPAIIVGSGGTVTTICTTVGISPTPALPGGEGVAIAPNPFHSTTTISLNEITSLSGLTFEIFNMEGKKMGQFPIISHETMINRNGLANGFYFYKLCNKEIVKSIGKLVIQ